MLLVDKSCAFSKLNNFIPVWQQNMQKDLIILMEEATITRDDNIIANR